MNLLEAANHRALYGLSVFTRSGQPRDQKVGVIDQLPDSPATAVIVSTIWQARCGAVK